jgi:AcrR family transcriptional regulator
MEVAMTEQGPADQPQSNREKIIDAFMGLLAERPFEEIGFGDIASRAGVSLAQCRDAFGSTFAVLAAHSKQLDRAVLSGGDSDVAEEPLRERLFDVLMRRLEIMAPHRRAVRSLLRSAQRNLPLGLGLNRLAVRSQQWMLTAANIDASGTRGAVRAQGLALIYASVLRTWVDDDDPGLARTMAALDRELARGERWALFLSDLCRLMPPRCRPRRGLRRRGPDADLDKEPIPV